MILSKNYVIVYHKDLSELVFFSNHIYEAHEVHTYFVDYSRKPKSWLCNCTVKDYVLNIVLCSLPYLCVMALYVAFIMWFNIHANGTSMLWHCICQLKIIHVCCNCTCYATGVMSVLTESMIIIYSSSIKGRKLTNWPNIPKIIWLKNILSFRKQQQRS